MTLRECRDNIGNFALVKFSAFIMEWDVKLFIIHYVPNDNDDSRLLFPVQIRTMFSNIGQTASEKEILGIIHKNNKLARLASL